MTRFVLLLVVLAAVSPLFAPAALAAGRVSAARPLPGAEQRFAHWRHLLAQTDVDEHAKLLVVNRFFNRLRQQDDRLTWGVPDYWASPVELLRVGAGDCEDLAIGKFVTLIAMGVPRLRLRLALTRVLDAPGARAEHHLVLTYRDPEGELWVLDNLVAHIARADRRHELLFLDGGPALAQLERHLAATSVGRGGALTGAVP